MLKEKKVQEMKKSILDHYDDLHATVESGHEYKKADEIMYSCEICNDIETLCEGKPTLSLIMMLYCKYSNSSDAIDAIAEELNLDKEYVKDQIESFHSNLKEAAEKTCESRPYVKKIG